MKLFAIVAISISCVAISNCFAKEAPSTTALRESLRKVPAAELPAKAAELVQAAKGHDREAVTVQVVKAALEINPAAAPAIAGAIAKAVPDMAALAASVAASEQPKQASAIARAAAAAAPSKAGKIVAAVCKAVPNDYRNIASAVSQAVPGSGREIVDAVASALPALKPAIEKALAGYGGNVASVAAVLDQATVTSSKPLPQTFAVSSGPATAPSTPRGLPRGPAVGPPYIPLSGTPTNTTPSTSGDVPPGGRNYSAP